MPQHPAVRYAALYVLVATTSRYSPGVVERLEGFERGAIIGLEVLQPVLRGVVAKRETPLRHVQRCDPTAEELTEPILAPPQCRRLQSRGRDYLPTATAQQ